MTKERIATVLTFVFLGVATRLLPHPPNFTALHALAVFGGVYLANQRFALAVVFATLFISDAVIGFYGLMPVVYACFGFSVFFSAQLGRTHTRIRAPTLVFASSVVFFFVTNAAVWLTSGLYPRSFAGLVVCFAAAWPFFQNQLLGDLFYGVLLFGGLYCAERLLPRIRQVA